MLPRIYSLILGLAISTIAFGQSYEFRVLANKGNNKVKVASTGQTSDLKTGSFIMPQDVIMAGNGAYIGLMHKTGKSIEVTKSGLVKVSDLVAKLSAKNSSVTSKYARFVMNKMGGDEDINKNYRQNMKATGAVERANEAAITLTMPNAVDLLNPEVIVRWNTVAKSVVYQIILRNIFDEEIYAAETENTTIAINFDDENLIAEQLVTLQVLVKNNDELFSPEYGIERLSPERKTEIDGKLNLLRDEISDDSPMNKLIFASFYEENNLLLDAITQYELVLKSNPEIDDFKIIYGDFLIRNNLN